MLGLKISPYARNREDEKTVDVCFISLSSCVCAVVRGVACVMRAFT